MKFGDFVKVKSLSNPQNFKENLDRLGLAMPCDESLESGETATMAQSKSVSGLQIGNRYAIHPMEGWDGQPMANLPRTPTAAGLCLADPARN